MGTYTFKWPNTGGDVFVTGTFDDWTKSVKLDKVDDGFEKVVTLPEASGKIYYKFVVDGEWTVNQAAPKENDPSGIENNFLNPEDIVKSAPVETPFISSVGPDATTVALLKDVPLEKEKKDEPKEEAKAETKEDKKDSTDAKVDMNGDNVPGAFPETPAADLDKEVKLINPLPASDGAVNPIKLAPGEKIPDSITSQDINANVKLDPESYEKADTLLGVTDVVAMLPPVTSTMIPESSLPIASAADVQISSVGPNATTVALAGEVPLEPKAPAIVKASQEKAGVDPEASAVSEEIKEKGQVEAELLQKVPEVPSTAEGTAGKGTEKSEGDKTIAEAVAATAAGLGAAAAVAAVSAKDSAVTAKDSAVEQATVAAAQLPDSVKQNLPESVQNAIAPTTQEEIRQEVSPEVPTEVKESIKEAGKNPEAAANTAAVEDKKAVETELLKEVQAAPAVGEESAKKTEETTAVKAAEETTAVKPAEETTAVQLADETTIAKPAADDTTIPKPAANDTTGAKPATNGSTQPSAPAATTAPETPTKKAQESSSASAEGTSPATTEKKKKNRLSMMLSKIKHKVSSSTK